MNSLDSPQLLHFRGAQRHGLARLIDLYERNYRLLEQLVPELDLPFDHARSLAGSEPELRLAVVARARYTCELRLYYRFCAGAQRPDLRVRVCRDALTAEALGDPPVHCWPLVDGEIQTAAQFLGAQWHRNLFLLRWLEYLLARGHGFSLAGRPRGFQPDVVFAIPRAGARD
ncbi:MAG TPA: DUF1249 domain-containing protein [Nevskiaceae bacterium]